MRSLAYCIVIHRGMLIIDADSIARHFLFVDFIQIAQLIQALRGIFDQFIEPCNRLGRQRFVFLDLELEKVQAIEKIAGDILHRTHSGFQHS